MGTNTFHKDLVESFKDEEIVINFLKRKGATDILSNGDGDYDLSFLLKGTRYTIEIKRDTVFKRTGNVAIEYRTRGKLCGIATSKADLWCYLLDKDLYFCNTQILRNNIRYGNYKKIVGGDSKASDLILIPIKEFKRIFKIEM